MTHRVFEGAAAVRAIAVALQIMTFAASPAFTTTIATTDPAAVAAFQSGRTVLGFDEIVVPAGPCYILLNPNHYAAQGILISAEADGSAQTHVATLPGCGHFGPTHSPPNIIGGGTGPGSFTWRQSVRFDFPVAASAIGAHSDYSGSNTTLTAYTADGTVIEAVTADEGVFMGIEAPGIAYAIWNWNYDISTQGFSIDNLTFSLQPTGVGDQIPSLANITVVPNPFDAETSVRWKLANPGRVRVEVYNVLGERVTTLLDAHQETGDGVVAWNGRDDRGVDVAAGVYILRFEVNGAIASRRIVRLR